MTVTYYVALPFIRAEDGTIVPGKQIECRNTCACRKLNPGILVMQSAEGWATKNVPGAIDGTRDRCIFLQG